MNSLSEIFTGTKSNNLSPLKNPFNKSKLDSVLIRAWNLNGKWMFYANIEFVNDNTTGVQKITGDSINEVIQKTDAFLKTLD